MSRVEFAKRCWDKLPQVPLGERWSEAVVIFRYLAEAGADLSVIGADEQTFRDLLSHVRIEEDAPARRWAEAQQQLTQGFLWVCLGEMEASLLVLGVDRASIGATNEAVGRLIRSLPKN